MIRAALFCGIVFTSWMAFSQQAKQTPKATSLPDVTASHITVKGCIQGTRQGHFTLLQVSTGAEFEILGDTNDFKRSSGKLVVVKANELAPTAKRGMRSLPHLKISNLRVVANQCPIQGHGRRPAESEAGNSAVPYEPPSPATPRYERSGDSDENPSPSGTNPNGAGVSGAPSPGTGNPPKP